jgi:glycosyltransferase involved in cell wall biosynthesis
MEAFSAGTPVVAYASGGIPELVRHGETGLLTAERTGESLAATLQTLLNDPALATRLSAQGRHEWEQRFRLERCQRELGDLIAEAGAATTGCHFQSTEEGSVHGERLGLR